MNPTRRDHEVPLGVLRVGLVLLFILSGLSGLIYQSVWSQYLGLILGHAAYAQALVLATFMGGMGAGAAIAARYAHRWQNLIRAFAGVEIVLGLAGLVFHLAFIQFHGFLVGNLLPSLPAGPGAGFVQAGAATALILPQSILLGISFPLLGAGLLRRIRGSSGRVLGTLYFANSIGAAGGALLATFLLVPEIGLPGAVQFAGLLNLLVGIAAWILGSDPRGVARLPRSSSHTAQPSSDLASASGERVSGKSLTTVILVVTMLSSAASFAYEIGWIRLLSLAVGTTLHAFELMLAAFIGGMALGGLWIRSRADHYRQPIRALGWIQVAMGLSAAGSLALYAAGSFEWVGYLMDALSSSDAGYQLYNAGTAAAAIVIMVPAAFFAGATLPLATTILLRRGMGESVIGKVYAFNTFGAIVGVFLGMFVLIPWFGLRNALLIAASVDVVLGLALIGLGTAPRSLPRRLGPAASCAIAGLVAAAALIEFDPLRLASGVFRSGQPALSERTEMIHYRDGKTASVSLYGDPDGLIRFIANNGKVDAAISMREGINPSADEPTMVLAGALPLAIHDQPRSSAVIGFGSGLTTHTLLADARLQEVKTIEIEAQMIEAARHFGSRVERAFDDPRSVHIVNDAKSVLAASGERYDLIVSEPSNPWMAGVGGLFASEFYEFVGQRLTGDGLFVQWLQLYEIDEALVGSVLSALTPNFDHVHAWMANSTDLIIIGSSSPIKDLVPERLFDGELGTELALAGIADPALIELREFADDGWLRAIGGALNAAPNSYYYPILGLSAPRTRFRNLNAEQLIRLAAEMPLERQLLGIGRPMPEPSLASSASNLPAERRTRMALDLIGRLEGNGDNLRQAGNAEQLPRGIELIREWSRDCRIFDRPEGTRAWLATYSELVAHSLPFLEANGARTLYSGEGWFECADEAPQGVKSAFALVEALASRNADEIPSAAMDWLPHALDHDLEASFLARTAYLTTQVALWQSEGAAAANTFRQQFELAVELDEFADFRQQLIRFYAGTN